MCILTNSYDLEKVWSFPPPKILNFRRSIIKKIGVTKATHGKNSAQAESQKDRHIYREGGTDIHA